MQGTTVAEYINNDLALSRMVVFIWLWFSSLFSCRVAKVPRAGTPFPQSSLDRLVVEVDDVSMDLDNTSHDITMTSQEILNKCYGVAQRLDLPNSRDRVMSRRMRAELRDGVAGLLSSTKPHIVNAVLELISGYKNPEDHKSDK